MSLMMSIYEHAKATTGITDILGTGDNIRFYPLIAAQGAARPYAVFRTIGAPPPVHTMQSDGGNPMIQRVRFESWADDLVAALGLADAIQAAYRDFAGALGGTGGLETLRILQDTMQAEDHDPEAGTEGRYVVRQEFLVHFRE